MRGMVLAVVAIRIGLACPAYAEGPADSGRSIGEALPLFGKNHCEVLKNPAEQLFCGDPELNAVAVKLNAAIQDRLSRLANRRLAIEENAEWIKNRNSSCGIFGRQSIPYQNLRPVQACLLKETEERIEILSDANFDCLATNTTAGTLICSDPSLAMAKTELNELVLGLIARLKEDDAKAAYAEYERWSRERDRKCDLVGKDNVPLDELSSSSTCLAEYISAKTAEVVAAKGDPKKVFGRHSALARARCRRRRSMRGANPCGQCLRELPHRQPRVSDRQRGGGAERAGDGPGRNDRAVAVFGLQSGRIELHGNVLGSEIGQTKSGAGKQGQFRGGAPVENRESVRVPENRRRVLALQYVFAAAGRLRRRTERTLESIRSPFSTCFPQANRYPHRINSVDRLARENASGARSAEFATDATERRGLYPRNTGGIATCSAWPANRKIVSNIAFYRLHPLRIDETGSIGNHPSAE